MLFLDDKATYWQQTKTGTGYTYSAPVVINCHWEARQRLVRTLTGEEKVSYAHFYTERNLSLPGKIVRGISALATPPTSANTIMAVEETRSPLMDETLYKVFI